jgi:hypothetical protein
MLPERFWSKVKKGAPTECWEWQGSRDEKGYGLFRYEGRLIRTLRLILISQGHDMTGKVGRHTCDNPPCCNPAHGIPGTNLDNIRDCIERGRRATTRGEQNNFAKLTEERVREIRRAYQKIPRSPGGYTKDGVLKQLAADFGVSYRNLMQIIRRETWTHI